MPICPLEPKKASPASRHRIFEKWHEKFIFAGEFTWVAVGDVNPIWLRNLLNQQFKKSRRTKRKSEKITETNSPLQAKTLLLESENQQAHLVLGFKAPAFHSKDYFPFRVLNTLLNGMGGRLFSELREKRSLAYSVFASHDAGKLGGIYQIYIGCAPEKIEQSKKEMIKVIHSVVAGSFSNIEIERAKTYMVGLYQVGLQSNRSQMHSYARYELTGFGAPWVERFPDLIHQITVQDIQRVANKYLDTESKTWVYLTPKGKGN